MAGNRARAAPTHHRNMELNTGKTKTPLPPKCVTKWGFRDRPLGGSRPLAVRLTHIISSYDIIVKQKLIAKKPLAPWNRFISCSFVSLSRLAFDRSRYAHAAELR
jgi:hypothetical protein